MVLDGSAEPMSRIWCLYEVARAKHYAKPFQLIVDEGDLVNASIDTLNGISKSLLNVRAGKAESSNELDKQKIHFRILDPVRKNQYTTFEQYKTKLSLYGVKDFFFDAFDVHICGLIATPLMEAGLQNKSVTVCLRAIGMGAVVTVDILNELTNIHGADLKAKVETRVGGMCGLATVFARSGRPELLKHMLDTGAEVDDKSSNGATALFNAAESGHVEICRILLARSAEVDKKTNTSFTALNSAAMNGHLKVCKLLLTHNADINNKSNKGSTPLSFAAQGGFVEVCKLLLDNDANVGVKYMDGFTALISASEGGHSEVCNLLLGRGACISDKTNRGSTALILAAQNRHMETCKLLLKHNANVHDKTNQGRTALHSAASHGHVETCAFLLDCGAVIDVKNNYKQTPLQEAKIGGHGENMELCTLLQNCDVN